MLRVEDGGGNAFGLYIHWPFCLSKCPYCDFNSHAGRAVDQGRWRAALLAELDHFAAETRHLAPTTLFFGGGTPSLMDPETVAALIARVRHHWPRAAEMEITLEANPTSVEAGRFRALAEAGVNRLSLGIQALDDQALRFLGRRHSVAEALKALETAKACFSRVSFDLIYARPGQGPEAWRDELDRALALAAGHLSLYQLTIEEGTAFAGRGDFRLPDEAAAEALYHLTQERTERAGLPAYEISNHAAPGQECRHNLIYWQGGQWLGIGPGAHGRVGGAALSQLRDPDPWLRAVESLGHGTAVREVLAPDDMVEERVMMGLRLGSGIGPELAAALEPERVAALVAEGFLISDARGLRTSATGLLLLNAVLGRLLSG